jgi:hypothetical protein
VNKNYQKYKISLIHIDSLRLIPDSLLCHLLYNIVIEYTSKRIHDKIQNGKN